MSRISEEAIRDLEKEIDHYETTKKDLVAVKWLKYALEVAKKGFCGRV